MREIGAELDIMAESYTWNTVIVLSDGAEIEVPCYSMADATNHAMAYTDAAEKGGWCRFPVGTTVKGRDGYDRILFSARIDDAREIALASIDDGAHEGTVTFEGDSGTPTITDLTEHATISEPMEGGQTNAAPLQELNGSTGSPANGA